MKRLILLALLAVQPAFATNTVAVQKDMTPEERKAKGLPPANLHCYLDSADIGVKGRQPQWLTFEGVIQREAMLQIEANKKQQAVMKALEVKK